MPQRSNASLARETKRPLRFGWVKGRRFESFCTKLLRGRADFKGRSKILRFSLALANCCATIESNAALLAAAKQIPEVVWQSPSTRRCVGPMVLLSARFSLVFQPIGSGVVVPILLLVTRPSVD
jgi:hypothetical protein